MTTHQQTKRYAPSAPAIVPHALNIMVLGAGAMGCLLGGRLAHRGQPVVLVDVHRPHIDAIRTAGLTLISDDGEQRIKLPCLLPTEVNATPDLIILFTKGMHSAAALQGIAPWIGAHTRILSLQNGLGNEEIIMRFIDRAHIILGITTYPADLPTPGVVHTHGAGMIRCMTLGLENDPYFKALLDLLTQAGFSVKADAQVFSAIWEKVAFNAALNSLCAVLDVSVDRLGAHPSAINLAMQISAEALDIAKAQGIPVDTDKVKKTILHAVEHHIGHAPSMLQDMRAKRATEIDCINGAVVTAAVQLNRQAPYNHALLELVRAKSALLHNGA